MYVPGREKRNFDMHLINSSQVYNMFHRQYMHKMLLDSATSEKGDGIPAKLVVNHKVNMTDNQRLTCLGNFC